MQTTNYSTYSERKLFTALNNTRTMIAKIQSEKEKIEKKLNAYSQKEADIILALSQKIMPSEQLKNAIAEVEKGEVVTFTSHDEAMGYLDAND